MSAEERTRIGAQANAMSCAEAVPCYIKALELKPQAPPCRERATPPALGC
ncbi:hypothetical protein OAO87_02865 [bacterium]|nr:hypothetical protein [bacterium]